MRQHTLTHCQLTDSKARCTCSQQLYFESKKRNAVTLSPRTDICWINSAHYIVQTNCGLTHRRPSMFKKAVRAECLRPLPLPDFRIFAKAQGLRSRRRNACKLLRRKVTINLTVIYFLKKTEISTKFRDLLNIYAGYWNVFICSINNLYFISHTVYIHSSI